MHKIINRVSQWWGDFLSLDNSRVNTGAVLAAVAVINAFIILNWSFFVYRKPLDTGTVALLSTMIGLGGWSYRESVKKGPPEDWKPPKAKRTPTED